MNLCIIQARSSSSRLPNKVLMTLNGESILERVFRICQSIDGIDEVVVATSNEKSDDAIEALCKEKNIHFFRGSLNNVLDRFYQCAKSYKATNIMRITADCPLLDPNLCSQILHSLIYKKLDYSSNVSPASWPDGLDCEVFSFKSLQHIMDNASKPSHKEHVTSFINENLHRFKTYNLTCPLGNLSDHRWTLDYKDDYQFIENVIEGLASATPSYIQILNQIKNKKLQHSLKENVERNEGLATSLEKEPSSFSFKESQRLLEQAETLIPVGSQTFSKSKYQYSPGYAPLFLSHGRGANVWDADGNKYIDLVNGLLPVVLGYCDFDVNQAISDQLQKGISFSLSTELEYKVAKKLNDHIPCAEKVRFGKNGTDATSACIRLARAFTGRDKVIACGYHGWQDWYIGSTTRSKGVPKATADLTSIVPYNSLSAVEELLVANKNEYACMIMEPMNITRPNDGYLSDLKKLLHKHGTLLIFDEVITGFRFHLGGAQSLFGVTPDLASFGKSMANGMPISAIVGRSDVMSEMDSIFYSGTFAGECLSLAATMAVIEKMETEPVIDTLWESGLKLESLVQEKLEKYSLENYFSLLGEAPWKIWKTDCSKDMDPLALKSFLLYELHKEGILTLGSHNVSYSLSSADINSAGLAYDKAFSKLKEAIDGKGLEKSMSCPTIVPIFRVR